MFWSSGCGPHHCEPDIEAAAEALVALAEKTACPAAQPPKSRRSLPGVLALLASAHLEAEGGSAPRSGAGGGGAAPPGAAYLSAFTASAAPAVRLDAYIERLLLYSGASAAEAIVALIYLDRLAAKNPALAVTRRNIHRLLLVCFVMALKVHEDCVPNNAYYAQVGGISSQELAALEIAFLCLVQWDLHVRATVFEEYLALFVAAQQAGG